MFRRIRGDDGEIACSQGFCSQEANCVPVDLSVDMGLRMLVALVLIGVDLWDAYRDVRTTSGPGHWKQLTSMLV